MPSAVRPAFAPRYAAVKSLDISNVAANTVADQTFNVDGLREDIMVVIAFPGLNAGLVICNAHVSAKNTLKVRFFNQTGSGIDPTAQNCFIMAF